MANLNNLYPPVIDTYMPAFVISQGDNKNTGACRVYFALSQYNSLEDIKSVWVTVNNQYTNQSVLVHPTGLKAFGAPEIDPERDGDDKYYITLNENDIINGWILNQLYKVQIRFCRVSMPENITADWVINNSNLFSEWSTVCLIQGIEKPVLQLNNFIDSSETTIFTNYENVVAGRVLFNDEEELESYELKIYKDDNKEMVYESGIVYTNIYNPNEINYLINYGFIEGERYQMEFTYTTRKLYQETKFFNFMIIAAGEDFLEANISATPDEENGCIIIHVSSDTERFFGNLTIRRSSSDTNFNIWYDVHTTAITDEQDLDYTWSDYTVESGIWYKYCVQKRNAYGDRGLIVSIDKPIMITLQDMFLTRGDQQLKIKFNPQVNSFKHTVSEGLTQTLGSKYPFIKRNANVNYREFSISGLISHFCDENELFMSENELYRQRKDLYLDYNDKHRINEYNDFTLERTFREKVQEFLYANNVKLFRSPAEGNILVRLMNISLTPETTLGRMIYSFSGTAYEIDEVNPNNLEKYGIQSIGTYNEYVLKTIEKTSQYSGSFSGDIKTIIQDIENGITTPGTVRTLSHFTNLKLQIESDPYLIGMDANGEPYVIKSSDETDKNTVLGYLIYIDGEPIIVNRNGRYFIENTSFNSLSSPVEINAIFDYSCIIKETEDKASIARQINYVSSVGQLWGFFAPTESLTEIIKDKYFQSLEGGYQKLFAINSIKLEVDPGTVAYIQDSSREEFFRYIIGNTGYLNIEDPDFSISGLYLLGQHLDKHEDGNERIKDNEFVEYTDNFYNRIQDIPNPKSNYVYYVRYAAPDYQPEFPQNMDDYFEKLQAMVTVTQTIGNIKYYKVIYYKDNWYFFTNNNDIIKPSQALVDYYYELEKGVY